MTEKDIIEGCKCGDASVQRVLYEQLGGLMYGVCRRYVRDRELAEDLLHDGFITVFTKIGEYRGEGSFEGWCRRIFVNTALGYLRKNNPLNESEDIEAKYDISSNTESAIDALSRQELLESIDKLPEGYRMVLNLFAVEGYSHKEIAEMLNISESTSRSQYLRAKRKLAEILGMDAGERGGTDDE